nr:SNAPIN protein homolog [Leptinotarsa decemlineata]
MDVDGLDSESTTTSIDENTENFCENPTRDTLTEGLMGLIKPTVDQLDERVRATRISQLELKQCIESLSEELKTIADSQKNSIDLEIYVKKLINAKQRVTILSNILQNTQDRLNKVHKSIDKEIGDKKYILGIEKSIVQTEDHVDHYT